MNDTIDLPIHHRARPGKPLLGLTLLLVEDSRFASEAIRLLSVRSGARVRRADCLASARRHLVVYRPAVAIVDLNLPDGSGTELIQTLASAPEETRARVLGTSGLENGADLAIAAGADGFLGKPVSHLGEFQAAVIAAMPVADRPTGPRKIVDEIIQPDEIALFDDLAQGVDMLTISEDKTSLAFVAQFLVSVAEAAPEALIGSAAEDVLDALGENKPYLAPKARLAALVTDRLTHRVIV